MSCRSSWCSRPQRLIHRRARRLLKRRERALQQADHRDPGELGIDSLVEAKELKGALELQHRTLYLFDLRVSGEDPRRSAASPASSPSCDRRTSSAPREMRIRRRLYQRGLRTRAKPAARAADRRDLDLRARDALAAPTRPRKARWPGALLGASRERARRDRAPARASADAGRAWPRLDRRG